MAQTNDELVNGATDTSNVVNYGMGYNLQRFSTLTQINKDNINHWCQPGITAWTTTEPRNLSHWSIRA